MKETIESSTIVDVRTAKRFRGGHFPNAIIIPYDQVAVRINDFKEMRKPIITYFRSGNRRGLAVSILKQNGINDVINAGGLDELKLKMK